MRWFDGITDLIDMSLSKLRELVRTGMPGVLQSKESQRVGHNWAAEGTSMFIFLRNMHIFYNSCKALHFHQQCTRFQFYHMQTVVLSCLFFPQYISLCIFFPIYFFISWRLVTLQYWQKPLQYCKVISLLPFLILPILTAMSGFEFHFPNKLSNFLSSGWPSIYHLFKKN